MDDERFQELKETEIKRLTTPLTYKKVRGGYEAYDCEGNPIKRKDNVINVSKEYILEPKPKILSDEEILMYAPESKTAAEIRLKRGIGSKSDKRHVNENMYNNIFLIGFLILFPLGLFVFNPTFSNLLGHILFFLIIILMIIYYIYQMYIKDYTEAKYKQETQNKEQKNIKNDKKTESTTNNDLLLLFESKEKIAREMIEKRFPAPQMTNTKFNAVLDNCKEVVESQIENLNALTPTEKTKYEIESRKKLIKQVISKIDDLTNELILSEESNLTVVVEEMDTLINSIKDYN